MTRRLRQSARGDAAAHGVVMRGFERVAEELERNVVDRGDIGAAFAVVVDGQPVVDLWAGLADRVHRRPWRGDTIAGIFSGTKGLVATCLLVLVERGMLELDEPVYRYWPEFRRHGKDGVLVRHVVAHQAGLPGLTTPVDPAQATDGRRMARLLAAQPLVFEPGARVCYHALTFGWLSGELIRRVDGRTAGRFFHDEIARPLSLDAWIGLPAEQEPRVAVFERGESFAAPVRDDLTRAADPVAWSIWENPPRFTPDDALPANARYWRAAEIPASNGVASARSLARLYGCLARGGEIGGVRLLQPETVERAATCLARGVDPYLQESMTYGVGFRLQDDAAPFGPARAAFGHPGAGGSIHGAWPELGAGFSYLTNALRDIKGPDPRSSALLSALHDALTSLNPARGA